MKRTVLLPTLFIALLFAALAIHLRMVARGPVHGHLAGIQVASIALGEPVGTDAAAAIKSSVLAAPGVLHCYVNAEAGMLSFGYQAERCAKQSVLRAVRQSGAAAAELREATAAELAGGCPVRVPKGIRRWLPSL
ncbi:MAG: hypothetical protein ACK4L7_02080 [Flavobacteriales bacterium]